MDRTPERTSGRRGSVTFNIAKDEDVQSPRRSSRLKKNPSVTPKRFTKFFTPRVRPPPRAVRTSRKALQALTAARINSRLDPRRSSGLPLGEEIERPSKKRRRLSFSSVASIPSSPIKREDRYLDGLDGSEHGHGVNDPLHREEDKDYFDSDADDDDSGDDDYDADDRSSRFPPRLIPYRSLGTSADLLSRRLGAGEKQFVEGNDSKLWQHETANFCSSPDDVCAYNTFAHRLSSLPFCAAGFKTAPLVAIGDEDGTVRVHDVESPHHRFRDIFLSLHPHNNAVMDLELSPDDSLLVTASGDQTCRIIDMKSQQAMYSLIGHTGSIKRVQFQPGSGNNVLASCSRDGSICLWDLRCAKPKALTLHLDQLGAGFSPGDTTQVNAANKIRDAHTSCDTPKKPKGTAPKNPISGRYDFAVTTCAFLDESRAHLLVTASENDAVVKLWDMRTTYKQRSGRPRPVSATMEPTSHQEHRQFGVTSIAMSTDGSRLYSLCRDHTVYVYSTSHLVLGSCPEMSPSSSEPFRQSGDSGHGLGPIYGFRHPSLLLGSFYDKLAVRGRTQDHTEMIAAGTREECAVIFPTGERYLTKSARRVPPASKVSSARRGGNQFAGEDREDCPIYYHGTALVNGHRKEVTAVTWTQNGNLVTTADDYTTRCWRENADYARSLRVGANREVTRHQSGWADVEGGYDDED